jgi:hypothetical protein
VITTNNAAISIQQFGRIWPQCVARAWQDTEFREALKRDPVATLRESYQFSLPTGLKMEILEGNEPAPAARADTLRMVIPPPPAVAVEEIAITDIEKGMMNAHPFSHHSSFTYTS